MLHTVDLCTSAFCQGHSLLRVCLFKGDSLLRGTASVFTPAHSPIFSVGVLNSLGWKTIPFTFINVFNLPLYGAIDPQSVYMFLYRMHSSIPYLITIHCFIALENHGGVSAQIWFNEVFPKQKSGWCI